MASEQLDLLEVEGQEFQSPEDRSPHARTGKAKFRDVKKPELFPSAPGNLIPQGHFVRDLAWALSQIDLRSILRSYDHMGGMPYHPLNLLAVILYGMTEGVRSGKDLQEHCLYDLRYRFLMGGHTPDDRTFQRFILRIEPYGDAICREVLSFLRKHGKAKGNVVVGDGARVSCSASWWKQREDLKTPPSDIDARLMNSHGRLIVGYNVQVAVDTEDWTILGAEVLNDQNDFHAAPALMEAVHDQHGSYPPTFIADTGYESSHSIEYLEERGIDTAIMPSDKLPEALSENADGVLCCPAGKPLKLTGHWMNGGRPYDRYRPEGGCRHCPLSGVCTFYRKPLNVAAGTDPGAKFRNRSRFTSQRFAGAYVHRRLVERIFAVLRRHSRFDRFYRRGLAKVKTEFKLWAAGFNLKIHIRGIAALKSCSIRPRNAQKCFWKTLFFQPSVKRRLATYPPIGHH